MAICCSGGRLRGADRARAGAVGARAGTAARASVFTPLNSANVWASVGTFGMEASRRGEVNVW